MSCNAELSSTYKRALIVYLTGVLLVFVGTVLYIKLGFLLFTIILLILTFSISYFSLWGFQLFFKAKEYHGEYEGKLRKLIASHRIPIRKILIIPSNHASACAFGFGNNRAICFSTKTIENFNWEEIEAVTVHELGHHKHQDIILYSAIALCLILFSAMVTASLSGTILTNILLGMFLMTFLLPLIMYVSRQREFQADSYVLQTTHNAAALASFLEYVVKELSLPENISKLELILLSHPRIYERINRLKATTT